MSVQKHWRIYFFLAAEKHILNFLKFYPQDKTLFYFSLSYLSIFQEIKPLLENEKTKNMTQMFHCSFGPAAKTARPLCFDASTVAPRPQPGPGLPKLRGRARPRGPIAGPCNLGRLMEIDGCALISREQNRGRVPRSETLDHSHFLLLSSLSLSAALFSLSVTSSDREDTE